MSGNKPTPGRTGYVIPGRLFDLSVADRRRIVSAHRGRVVTDLDRDEDVYVASSVQRSRSRIDGALAVPCAEHDAAPGCYCWDFARSRVRGLCAARYVCGVHTPARAVVTDPARRSAEVAELAQAARYAQRDARLRLNARHPVTTARAR